VGVHSFAIRHVAYEPVDFSVEFTADTAISITIPLELRGYALQAIEINDSVLGEYARKLRGVGFDERLGQAERSAVDATFITPLEMQRRRAVRLSHLLEGQRSIKIRFMGITAIAYGRDGQCVMSVWVDGQEMRNIFPTGSNQGSGAGSIIRTAAPRSNPASFPGLDLIDPNDIAAIEIYPSASGTPPQFQNLTGNCGAIVIWTKQ
jgi:hypothetical protein